MTLLMLLALAKVALYFLIAAIVIWKRQPLTDFVLTVFGPEPDEPTLRCGWCKDIIRRGAPNLPISDGLCGACRIRLEQSAIERHERRRLNAIAGGRQ